MINIYESIQDKDGRNISGRTKLFIQKSDEFGEIVICNYGTLYTPSETGSMFIVDEWLIDQLHKLQFLNGELSVKDGEELIPPVKSDKERMIEKMERQLAALKAEPDEPANTEEPTGNEQLLLEDPENNTDIKPNE